MEFIVNVISVENETQEKRRDDGYRIVNKLIILSLIFYHMKTLFSC